MSQANKPQVFDRLRKRYVRLTPEEAVRRDFVDYLIDEKHYPESLLANEVCIRLGNVRRRCDTVLYDRELRPQMIVEYKAPTVRIDQTTFDQIARYNYVLKVPWLVITNGLECYCCRVDEKGRAAFVKELPDYTTLFDAC
jgi:hypothetical protein